jgi:hypothetical protein
LHSLCHNSRYRWSTASGTECLSALADDAAGFVQSHPRSAPEPIFNVPISTMLTKRSLAIIGWGPPTKCCLSTFGSSRPRSQCV